jgi:hypothetical protein
MKNAVIEYLYRDAANYTKVNQCIISGVVTADMERIIWGCLDEDVYFIPSQVGLPEERKGTIDPNLDHCWFEWGGVFALTNEAPTVDITAEKLVQNFQARKGKWDDTQREEV